MSTDYSLVMGIFVAILGVPAILGAAVDGRAPRVAVLLVIISGGLIAYAVTQKPGGYGAGDIYPAFTRVVNDFMP